MRTRTKRPVVSNPKPAKAFVLYAVWAVVALTVVGLAFFVATDVLNPPPPATVVVSSADGVQRIAVEDAKARQDAGVALLLDARTEAVYAVSHAAGAVHLVETGLDAQVAELPRDMDLILYCT